jgi:hypothetical protein
MPQRQNCRIWLLSGLLTLNDAMQDALLTKGQGGQVATDVFCGGSDNKPLTMSLVKDSGE